MQIQATKDGSHTLFNATLNETYHSKFGAIEESKYVFLEQGLRAFISKKVNTQQEPITVFEIGYGTGLNALLFANFATENKVQIQYTGIDILPLSKALMEQLNYVQLLPAISKKHFEQLNEAAWDEHTQINDCFEINKFHTDLHQFDYTQYIQTFDLILMDAFAPDKQPDMWQNKVFKDFYLLCKPEAIVVTYTSKGTVKRGLLEAGFTVEKLPGPPMKRHMLRATKPLQNETI